MANPTGVWPSRKTVWITTSPSVPRDDGITLNLNLNTYFQNKGI